VRVRLRLRLGLHAAGASASADATAAAGSMTDPLGGAAVTIATAAHAAAASVSCQVTKRELMVAGRTAKAGSCTRGWYLLHALAQSASGYSTSNIGSYRRHAFDREAYTWCIVSMSVRWRTALQQHAFTTQIRRFDLLLGSDALAARRIFNSRDAKVPGAVHACCGKPR
jgi:hypothetical protein